LPNPGRSDPFSQTDPSISPAPPGASGHPDFSSPPNPSYFPSPANRLLSAKLIHPFPGSLQGRRGIRIPRPRGLSQELHIIRLNSLLPPTQLTRRTAVPLLRNRARRSSPIPLLARDQVQRPQSLREVGLGSLAGLAAM
jgi:hypothetical protein